MVPGSNFPIYFALSLTKLLFPFFFKKELLPPQLFLLKGHDQDITFLTKKQLPYLLFQQKSSCLILFFGN